MTMIQLYECTFPRKWGYPTRGGYESEERLLDRDLLPKSYGFGLLLPLPLTALAGHPLAWVAILKHTSVTLTVPAFRRPFMRSTAAPV